MGKKLAMKAALALMLLSGCSKLPWGREAAPEQEQPALQEQIAGAAESLHRQIGEYMSAYKAESEAMEREYTAMESDCEAAIEAVRVARPTRAVDEAAFQALMHEADDLMIGKGKLADRRAELFLEHTALMKRLKRFGVNPYYEQGAGGQSGADSSEEGVNHAPADDES